MTKVEQPGCKIQEPGASVDLPWPELIAELHAIHNLSDAIYIVRDLADDDIADGDDDYDGDLWNHPRVERYAELIEEITKRLKAEGIL